MTDAKLKEIASAANEGGWCGMLFPAEVEELESLGYGVRELDARGLYLPGDSDDGSRRCQVTQYDQRHDEDLDGSSHEGGMQ